MRKSIIPNNRHTFGNINGGEAAAIIESPDTDTRYTIRDSDGGEAAAILESIVSNARHTILYSIVSNSCRDGDAVGVAVWMTYHFHRLVHLGSDIVIDVVHRKISATRREAAQQHGNHQ